MAGLEELKKRLEPLFNADEETEVGVSMEPCDSYMASDGGTVNLLSKSRGAYNINELGLRKHSAGLVDEETGETMYRCASHEMHTFGAISRGGSSVVHRAIHIPIHRVLALKKINIFEKEKREQLLNEIRTLCEACCYQGLVEFHGAFYSPASGQISIALEYMDGGSLADVLRLQRSIPEPELAHIVHMLLTGLSYLHGVRHLIHRDIKPANLLIDLKGEPKITDFGISADLDDSIDMSATFVGTIIYMSPERIQSANYSYPADIWSLGLAIFECGTGRFPYTANDGAANLMLQILHDPSPTPSRDLFSPEFCSFIDDCLQKDANLRPTAEQLLSHPFIRKYEKENVDLAAFTRAVFDPTQRLKEIADMLTIHYYLLFDGDDGLWHHMRTIYDERSTFSFSGKEFVGSNDIFAALSDIRKKLAGDHPREKLVHVVDKRDCHPYGQDGIAIYVSGYVIVGTHSFILGSGVEVEGILSFEDLSQDASNSMGIFHEQFIMEPGSTIGSYIIAKQELDIQQE